MLPPPTNRTAELAIEWQGLELTGTLRLPASAGPSPIVVMMQGSGPADRDSDGYFLAIRDSFVRRGLATYCFDKPGCGSSTGDWHDHALNSRVDQVIAVIDSLRHESRVDGSRIGIFGHSQGGWMAQILAARDIDLRCAIATSGPTMGVAEQDRYAAEQQLLLAGLSVGERDAALRFLGRMHHAARKGVALDTLERTVLNPARRQSWFDDVAIADAADWRLTKLFLSEAYEPADALGDVRCPFLAIYGGQDILLPAWECSVECGQMLTLAPARDAMVVVFPNADHRLRDPSGEFVGGYLDLLTAWSATRLGLGDRTS